MPMNAAKLLLLNVLGGSATPVTYLFRDEFTTDAAAPLGSPRAAEPGPGLWTVTDTDNAVSQSGGELVVGGTTFIQLTTTALTREVGLMADVFIRRTANLTDRRFYLNGMPLGGAISDLIEMYGDCSLYSGDAVLLDTNYRFRHIVRSSGVLYCKDGVLIWVGTGTGTGETGPFSMRFQSSSNRARATAGWTRIRQLPAPYDTDYWLATSHVASPADATEYTGSADGIIDLTVTAPGTLDGSASTRCGFYYRADSDLSPAWQCYVDGTGAFNLDSIDAAGTRTNRIAAAGVITGGATRTLRVIAVGTKHNAYSLSGTTWAKRGAEITLSLNDAVTTIEPSVPAGWTAANLDSWPRTIPSAALAEMDRT